MEKIEDNQVLQSPSPNELQNALQKLSLLYNENNDTAPPSFPNGILPEMFIPNSSFEESSQSLLEKSRTDSLTRRSAKIEKLVGQSAHHSPFPEDNASNHANSLAESKVRILDFMKVQVMKHLQHSVPSLSPMSGLDAFVLGQLQHEKIETVIEQNVQQYGINVKRIFHNAAPSILYEQALANEPDSYISSTGALCCSSGAKTGRSPSDKRIVRESSCDKDIWWGRINIPMLEKAYLINRERAVDYLNLQDQLYVVDGFAGWDLEYRIKIRVITTRAYHALFMQNMLVRPTLEELDEFKPDFLIYNAGCFVANRYTLGVTSQTHVSIHFGRGEMVILGTQYAGEMKKGVFTLMMYLMPKCGQLPLHSSCNVGQDGDLTLFFGLSGTGKTTLSADKSRSLIGDDEHVWTDNGIFNIEGGCYAKCKDLSKEQEPDIFEAIRFGSVLENVKFDEQTRIVDYSNVSLTENTRCAYPLEFIQNSILPAKSDRHPSNIILLTCDAFGVLPPVSLLSTAQAMYHFISGYTSKMAGTEQGILEPTAIFSSCYGAPFLAVHPLVYAEMLAKKLEEHKTRVWLLNTGWIRGAYGSVDGKRIPLKYTRAMVTAIHNSSILQSEFEEVDVFQFKVPKTVPDVDPDILFPGRAWRDQSEFRIQLEKLALLFVRNFEQFHDRAEETVLRAGPKI
ncbi:PEP-carboxykinase I [Cardiosporidium cionae]|uniref:phosphoenolpyruvate carboxykinase (ATP) n=1 Tax=Cardiosporidium cionae TaxID=476202 RepID=A0A3Q8UBH4_9APIC|nr:phosphoenolpyruvate carboxykinase [Cardiosporidium cionae]KAF8820762.1 PEP-carboxykinase I [Cardiosporidium cionae]|eukprot:KAF8820762.1 PEP-carboxykinase I [Cardiosporidium cionae]